MLCVRVCVCVRVCACHRGTLYPLPPPLPQAYIKFMTTPGSHNDVYAGTCHRMFFRNYVDGKDPKKCADNDGHNVCVCVCVCVCASVCVCLCACLTHRAPFQALVQAAMSCSRV
jgi:hypothetical protein